MDYHIKENTTGVGEHWGEHWERGGGMRHHEAEEPPHKKLPKDVVSKLYGYSRYDI